MAMTMNSSLTGMSTAALGVQVTANNVANLRSEGYQAKRMDQADLPEGGGTRPSQIQASQEPPIPQDNSNVQLEREMVSLIRDERAYTANAAVISTQSQMMGTAMDLKA